MDFWSFWICFGRWWNMGTWGGIQRSTNVSVKELRESAYFTSARQSMRHLPIIIVHWSCCKQLAGPECYFRSLWILSCFTYWGDDFPSTHLLDPIICCVPSHALLWQLYIPSYPTVAVVYSPHTPVTPVYPLIWLIHIARNQYRDQEREWKIGYETQWCPVLFPFTV